MKLLPAPARIKLSPALPVFTPVFFRSCPFLGDVLTLPVQLRPPEMGIVVVIEAFCRYWEGGFVSGGWKCCSWGRGCLEICLTILAWGADFASRPEIRKLLWQFHGFNARSFPLGINPPPLLCSSPACLLKSLSHLSPSNEPQVSH